MSEMHERLRRRLRDACDECIGAASLLAAEVEAVISEGEALGAERAALERLVDEEIAAMQRLIGGLQCGRPSGD